MYVALLRHGRRRTVQRSASRDVDVTDDAVTMIGGYWQLRGPDVDTDLATTTLDGNVNSSRNDNVYGAVIITQPLREFTQFI